jgi:hypothetical protein
VKFPSFEDLAKVIRDSARLKMDKRIDPDTQVLRDLNISGTDGARLLKAIEDHHQIRLTSEICDRKQFHSSPEKYRIQSLPGGVHARQAVDRSHEVACNTGKRSQTSDWV